MKEVDYIVVGVMEETAVVVVAGPVVAVVVIVVVVLGAVDVRLPLASGVAGAFPSASLTLGPPLTITIVHH